MDNMNRTPGRITRSIKSSKNQDFEFSIGKSVKFGSNSAISECEENDLFFINDSQRIPANQEVEEIPNSQKLTEYHSLYKLPKPQKNSNKLAMTRMSFTDDSDEKCMKNVKEIGTMTDCLTSKKLHFERQGNELFGQFVAYEISNYHGKARFDKMKEILETFQKIDIT